MKFSDFERKMPLFWVKYAVLGLKIGKMGRISRKNMILSRNFKISMILRAGYFNPNLLIFQQKHDNNDSTIFIKNIVTNTIFHNFTNTHGSNQF